MCAMSGGNSNRSVASIKLMPVAPVMVLSLHKTTNVINQETQLSRAAVVCTGFGFQHHSFLLLRQYYCVCCLSVINEY